MVDDDGPIDESLLQWVRDHGGVINDVTPSFVPQGWRGIIATRDIEPDECIVSIPLKLLICLESARQDDAIWTQLVHQTNLSDTQIVAIHLIHQCSLDKDSFWHVYLRSLPPSYTTALCFASSQQDVDELQVPYAMHCVSIAIQKATNSYTQALPILSALKMNNHEHWTSFQIWLWALSTLASRTMYMPTDETGALVPFGDLHNFHPHPPPYTPRINDIDKQEEFSSSSLRVHSLCGDGGLSCRAERETETNDTAKSKPNDAYKIFTRRHYSQGEEIYLNYGRHTNLELLEHYGFVLQDNPHDVAVLPVELFSEAVQRQLDEWGALPLVHNNGNPSWELLRALRLTSLSKEERKSKASAMALSDKKVNEKNEKVALRALEQVCKLLLNDLPTTIEEDSKLLKAGSEKRALSECARVAVEWRVAYKHTLQRCIQLCRQL